MSTEREVLKMAGEQLQEAQELKISHNTLIPLGAAVAIVFAVISLHVWINSQFSTLLEKLDTKFSTLDAKIIALETKILSSEKTQQVRDFELRQKLSELELQFRHRWTSLDMQEWIIMLRETNPSLKVPPLKHDP